MLLLILTSAWRSIAELSFRYSRLETEADFVQIAPSSEIVVVVSFDVNVGMNQY
jgi:flagellar motor switch protein FliM